MKHFLVIFFNFCFFANAYSQGITLLYTGANGSSYSDSANWTQIDVPAGQSPEHRPPTYIDDVVFSKAMSGLTEISLSAIGTDTFKIGGGDSTSFCRRMYVRGLEFTFGYTSFDIFTYGRPVFVYTQNGGFLSLDSGTVLQHGIVHLFGGNSDVAGLRVTDSEFGTYAHYNADWTEFALEDDGRALFKRSTFKGFYFGSPWNGSGYAKGSLSSDSSDFYVTNFILGDNSVDTFLNSSIRQLEVGDDLKFLIGKNAQFISENNTIVHGYGSLDFTTSGSVFKGNVTGWYFNFRQEDPANPLPNIIDGDVIMLENVSAGISGDVKVSGNFINYMPPEGFYPAPIPVDVNSQHAFDVGGVKNFATGLSINNCTGDYCHYKMEFFGNTNSNINWSTGFPIDTLIINKSECAKVTSTNSLYVAGQTRILSGQLALEPNDGVPYKLVTPGDIIISPGGGLFLKKDSTGEVANIAIAGAITDHNTTQDSTCEGFSNPYNGNIVTYARPLPVTLLNFSGRFYSNSITLNWQTEDEFHGKRFIVEKSYDPVSFIPLAEVNAGGRIYNYIDKTLLREVNYYRLKSVEADGRFTYSKTIAVVVPNDRTISLYPNPVKDKLSIHLHDVFKPIEVSIIDMKGLNLKNVKVNPGARELFVNTSDLPAGIYMIVLHSTSNKKTLRFVRE
jgi:hypothetical protein